MLQEQELKTFVDGTTNYFEVAAQQPASIGSPYLMEGSPSVHDYTGVINISGKREGVVYFTAPKAMLTVLLMKMQENDFSHETMRDLVGEVANTISGNARRDFGRDFVISVPSVLSGEKPEIPQKPGPRSFVIPINWRSHSAKLVVSLDAERAGSRPRPAAASVVLSDCRRIIVGAQPVAEPGLGDEIARLARIGLELGAQVLHAHAQAARVVLALRAPHLADQLALHDDRAQVARQTFEHPILERRQVQLAVRAARLAAREIDLQRRPKCRMALLAPRRARCAATPHAPVPAAPAR